MKRLIAYYRYNFFSMFMIGLLGGAVCLGVYIILSGIVSENFKFKYNATTMISIEGNDLSITEEDCNELFDDNEVKTYIKKYLGNYITYDEFKKCCSLTLEDNIMTVDYINENEDRAKRTVNRLGNVVCGRLVKDNKIEDYTRIGVTQTERIKEYDHNMITRLPITLFTEMGIIAGFILAFIIYTIVYIVNGKIKSEKDVVDELNIMVLATIPHIDELGEMR